MRVVRELAGEKIEEKGQRKSGHFGACILANVFSNAAISIRQYISKRALEIHSECYYQLKKKTQNHKLFSTATSKHIHSLSFLSPGMGKESKSRQSH